MKDSSFLSSGCQNVSMLVSILPGHFTRYTCAIKSNSVLMLCSCSSLPKLQRSLHTGCVFVINFVIFFTSIKFFELLIGPEYGCHDIGISNSIPMQRKIFDLFTIFGTSY